MTDPLDPNKPIVAVNPPDKSVSQVANNPATTAGFFSSAITRQLVHGAFWVLSAKLGKDAATAGSISEGLQPFIEALVMAAIPMLDGLWHKYTLWANTPPYTPASGKPTAEDTYNST